MKTLKKRLSVNIGQFDVFDPANILLQDAVSGAVPKEEGTLVVKEFMQQSVLTRLAKYEQMNKQEKKFTYLASGPGAYWVGEGERIQTDKATWLTANLKAKKLGVIIPVSKEFLKYTVKDFFTQMRPAIAEAFAIKFDQAGLFGVGSPFEVGTSVFERIQTAGHTIALDSLTNLYDELNGVMAFIEDADKDPDGFTTTRKFKQNLRGAKDGNNQPIFTDATAGSTSSALGLPIGYADSKSWDYAKALLIAGNWDMTRYGMPAGMEYTISTDATLTTIADAAGNPINLFERDMFALRVTQEVAFTTLAADAFAAITPAVVAGG